MAARKSKHHTESAAAALDELQTRGDRLSQWITENPVPILGTAAVILVVAAIYGFATSRQDTAAEEAAASLAAVQSEYRDAMGATPDSFEIPEPANPETALQVRTEYLERFLEVAEEHAGTPTAALARLEAGELQDQLGNPEAASATWRAAADAQPEDDPIRALLLQRLGASLEERELWSEAAAAYEVAAAIPSFPLRYAVLIDAARCRAEAGEAEQAIANFARVEEEAPEQAIPQYVAAQVAELRAAP